MDKAPLYPDRIRQIRGSFAFIEHRLLRDGFWEGLNHYELLLYLFLVIVGDRRGMSYYSYDKICILLKISVDDYIAARNSLIEKDLIAFDGKFFQVLSLPDKVVKIFHSPIKNQAEMEKHDPVTIHQLTVNSLRAKK
ncbi:MAG: helix-turn-helix domain-containing protein [Deltaproteobacteria bacterium]|nr:helix-turn-helix domain-containing protein [Deltaproteobacteria bacterium]